jgi:DNA-binding beta-propeller fold protein YncE
MLRMSIRDLYAIGLAALLCAAALAPASASADPPPLFSQFCEGTAGQVEDPGTGGCRFPGAIATDPATGDVYLADPGSDRIDVFSVWGTFVRAWGWGVRDGNKELQTCTAQTRCLPGLAPNNGTAQDLGNPGQLNNPRGIALDSAGDVYVVDTWWRVQKFDPEGHFLLMFGRGVDQGPSHPGNLCTVKYIEEGDTCGAGSEGSGNGEFSVHPGASWPFYDFIDVGPGDKVYVGDNERIQRFDTGGSYVESIPVLGEQVKALAVDQTTGGLYVSLCLHGCGGDDESTKPEVRKLSPSGILLDTLTVERPLALATDGEGNLYVADSPGLNASGSIEDKEPKIRKFTSGGAEVSNFTFSDFSGESRGIATSSACGVVGTNLYVSNGAFTGSFVRAYGAAPDAALCPPPNVPPRIDDQYVTAVDTTGATLKARIGSEFFSDTTYYVEYGTGKCSEGGCDKRQPLAPGSKLTNQTTNKLLTTAGIFLSGLEPNTTYHYRFVTQSSGGGPVKGVGGKEGIDGSEDTFKTFPLSSVKTDCPNQVFRSGTAAPLPDCRAYEMVSPAEKNGGNVITGEITRAYTPILRTSPDGERVTFSSLSSFANPSSSPLVNQYFSRRGTAGWSTESIAAARGLVALMPATFADQYKAFSEDLCSAWLLQTSDFALTPDAPPGVMNAYRRNNCGGNPFEVLSDVAPPGIGGPGGLPPEDSLPLVGGFSADKSHVVFREAAPLTKNACKTTGLYQVYETSSEGELRLVSLLPNGTATCSHSSPGMFFGSPETSRESSFFHAVSEDGSTVYWTDSGRFAVGEAFPGQGPGRLYVRINATEAPSKPGSGCSEPEKGCTLPVFTAGAAFFWGAAADGSRAIYGVGTGSGEELFEYDLENEESMLIAKGSFGVAGMSEDASRVYLVSKEVLTAVPNSQGDVAQAGRQNLYLYEMGEGATTYTFIGEGAAGTTSIRADGRTSRVTPDGRHLVFVSSTPLTGYDNTSLGSGAPATELYLYDDEAGGPGQLHCVSCNPSGGRPAALKSEDGTIGAAISATLPSWPEQLRPSRLLTEDGSKLFFQTYDALLPADTNGAQDVYEWEWAEGPEGCKAAGAQTYSPDAEGCISLISSGQSPEDSEVMEASSGGTDVFFITNSGLLPQDVDLYDIYDARTGGGFPPPPAPPAACEGEACQGAPAPPNDPTPASSAFEGAGNVVEKPAKKKAHKKKHARKHKAKKNSKAKKRANENGRAGR